MSDIKKATFAAGDAVYKVGREACVMVPSIYSKKILFKIFIHCHSVPGWFEDPQILLEKRPTQEPTTTVLVRLAELVLTLNIFSFGGQHYQEISGVAMRTKMGPNYASLFFGFVEKQIFGRYTGRYLITLVGTLMTVLVQYHVLISSWKSS